MMLIRYLILALLIWLGYRYVRRLLRSAFSPTLEQSRDDRGPEQAVFQGEMVRDPVCNAYLSKERALTLTESGHSFFFCSEGCRRKFLESAGPSREEGDRGP